MQNVKEEERERKCKPLDVCPRYLKGKKSLLLQKSFVF